MACATFTTPFGGCGVGVIVGVSVMVGVSVGESVRVSVTNGVAVTSGVAVTVGVGVTVGVRVTSGVAVATGQGVLVLDGTMASARAWGLGESPTAEQPARNMPVASRILRTERPSLVIRIFSFGQ